MRIKLTQACFFLPVEGEVVVAVSRLLQLLLVCAVLSPGKDGKNLTGGKTCHIFWQLSHSFSISWIQWTDRSIDWLIAWLNDRLIDYAFNPFLIGWCSGCFISLFFGFLGNGLLVVHVIWGRFFASSRTHRQNARFLGWKSDRCHFQCHSPDFTCSKFWPLHNDAIWCGQWTWRMRGMCSATGWGPILSAKAYRKWLIPTCFSSIEDSFLSSWVSWTRSGPDWKRRTSAWSRTWKRLWTSTTRSTRKFSKKCRK